MKPLSHVLMAAWSDMPPEVLASTRMTRGGLPVKAIRESFLIDVMREAGAPVTQRMLTAAGASRVEDSVAAMLATALSSDTVRRRAASYAWWVDAVDRVRDRPLGSDDVHRLARELEAAHGEAAIPLRDQLAAVRIGTVTASRRLRGEALRRIWSDPAERARLTARLEGAWARREVPPSRPSDADRHYAFLDEVGWASDLTPSVTDRAERLWKEILREGEGVGDDAAVAEGLTGADVVRMPWLTAAPFDERDDTPPLDRSVEDRLSRVLRGSSREVVIRLDAREAADAVVDASAEAAGLPTGWARTALSVGVSASALMTWNAGDVEDERLPDRMSGGRRSIARGWRLRVEKMRRGGPRAHTEDAVAFYQNPRAYYLGRLWTRLLRRTLASPESPSAAEVWADVYGAFVSTREHLLDVTGDSTEMVTLDRHVERAGREVDGSVVIDVLHGAVEQFGSLAVFTFWNEVAVLPTPRGADRLAARWDEFLEAENVGASTPLRVPFAVAHAWLTEHGALSPRPSLYSSPEQPDGARSSFGGTSHE